MIQAYSLLSYSYWLLLSNFAFRVADSRRVRIRVTFRSMRCDLNLRLEDNNNNNKKELNEQLLILSFVTDCKYLNQTQRSAAVPKLRSLFLSVSSTSRPSVQPRRQIGSRASSDSRSSSGRPRGIHCLDSTWLRSKKRHKYLNRERTRRECQSRQFHSKNVYRLFASATEIVNKRHQFLTLQYQSGQYQTVWDHKANRNFC